MSRLFYSPPFIVLLGIVFSLLLYRWIEKNSRPPLSIHLIRWFLGTIFLCSGLAKLLPGFPNTMGPVQLESELAPYGLAMLARFVAVSEAAVGLLLCTRRFPTLGAVILLPMLTVILIITISLQWRGTPYVNTFFLLLNGILIFYDADKFKPVIGMPATSSRIEIPLAISGRLWAWIVVFTAFFIWLGVFRFEPYHIVAIILSVVLSAILIIEDWRQTGRPTTV